MTEELDVFRDQFRKFLAKDLAPHGEKWRSQKMVDRSAWRALGEMGALLSSVPEAYGGLGATFAYEAAVLEDLESVVPEMTTGVSVHSAIVAHYILNYGSEEQKLRWLPKMASGEFITRGLSMPHSPRWHDGRLWVLESGTGGVVLVDPATGKRETVAHLPGFTRGWALAGPYAFVGLSKIRPTSAMDGVPLAERREQLKCGVAVVDLRSGQTMGLLEFQTAVEEIFAAFA
jgi:hypothetical protein